ncbi:uncharacterized protein EV422DRAFT_415930 [Fimicolochytrium jonesii]|uniref:uncharacterized protein n=1 Tax=Fimicolochytrium jonesii TaxID=1396493 RepID=UPI0022FE779C|nr:uncharacterized protein EV422DRAFT_415930 [Fimicolochytrium jonesii]KAI8822064.1 hypothetical protein EV422DRAFT_415930 [Fimicolochytrium jonesii]
MDVRSSMLELWMRVACELHFHGVASSLTPSRCKCEAISGDSRVFHKLMQMLKPKCHAIFLDASLNSLPTVIVSVYDNLRLCAMKFVAYVRLLGFGNALSVDVFLHRKFS